MTDKEKMIQKMPSSATAVAGRTTDHGKNPDSMEKVRRRQQ